MGIFHADDVVICEDDSREYLLTDRRVPWWSRLMVRISLWAGWAGGVLGIFAWIVTH